MIEKKKFKKRWNIEETEEKEKMKIRCLTIISNYIHNEIYFMKNFDLSNKYIPLNYICNKISIILGVKADNSIYNKFEDKFLYKYINQLDLEEEKNYITFIRFIELFINYDFQFINKKELATSLSEAIKFSCVNLRIIYDNEEYIIINKNVELLDKPLINDNLNWLSDFPKTKEHFLKSIKFERKEEYFRNIIDELRISLEFLFKELFNNEKSLENQKSNIGDYFKDNKISKPISNMYTKLFELYTTYNNVNVKHGDNINESEIDFMIYLTGLFIRLISQIEESKKDVK